MGFLFCLSRVETIIRAYKRIGLDSSQTSSFHNCLCHDKALVMGIFIQPTYINALT
jgi:hypothetical protein